MTLLWILFLALTDTVLTRGGYSTRKQADSRNSSAQLRVRLHGL
jgi:hypothetical protein